MLTELDQGTLVSPPCQPLSGDSAIAAYGAFFIPKSYGTSIALTGGPAAALWTFLIFYVLCALITFAVYTRKGGLLHDIEHGRATPAQPAN